MNEDKLIEINESIDGLGDGLMNLESQVNNMIKTVTVSGITSESGNMKLLGVNNTRIIIGVKSADGAVLIPYLNKNGQWYVHAVNAGTNEVIANKNMTVLAAYIG